MDPVQELKNMVTEIKTEVTDAIKAQGEAQNKSAEEIAAKVKEATDGLDERVKSLEDRFAKNKLSGAEDDKEVKAYSVEKVVRHLLSGKPADDLDGLEGDIHKQMKTRGRAMTADDGSAGGVLVGTEILYDQLIMPALADMPIRDLGMTLLPGLTGNVDIPRVTSRHTAYWVGEGEVPTESNTALGDLELRPKELSAWGKLSNKLMKQAPGIAESIIRQSLSEAINLKLEESLIIGTGTDKSIKGLAYYDSFTDVDAIGTNGGAFTFDHAATMIEALEDADEFKSTGKYGYLTHPKVKNKLKRTRIPQYSGDSGGMYIVPPIMTDAMLADMLGQPIRATTKVPKTLTKGGSSDCAYVFLGNWPMLVMGIWEDMAIRTSNLSGYSTASAFLQRQTWVVLDMMVDANIKRETAFCKISDARTN